MSYTRSISNPEKNKLHFIEAIENHGFCDKILKLQSSFPLKIINIFIRKNFKKNVEKKKRTTFLTF